MSKDIHESNMNGGWWFYLADCRMHRARYLIVQRKLEQTVAFRDVKSRFQTIVRLGKILSS